MIDRLQMEHNGICCMGSVDVPGRKFPNEENKPSVIDDDILLLKEKTTIFVYLKVYFILYSQQAQC